MNRGDVIRACGVLAILLLLASSATRSATPIAYRLTLSSPEHHWMQIEAVFTDLGSAPLELRMSRSSPGRYSLHEFAKNVYDVEAMGSDGRALTVTRPDPYGWTVPEHGAALTVRYRVFGDRLDGTYLAIDTSHAHVNMPSAILWARGMDDRPVTLTFVPPSKQRWQVATQLHAGANPLEFTAPNLQYLMDSPAELGPVSIKQFEIEGHTFRFAAHHTGTAAELDGFVKDVEKIVRVEAAVFGEFPSYEPGTYTFLADYLPYASGDGMEHRNSTVMTSSGSIRDRRGDLLDTVAHEFFHCWNVERIRPRSLEPFDLERVNMSGELWLAEGFTQYYGPVALSRAGLEDLGSTVATLGGLIQTVTTSPGHDVRSAEEMSRMAAFTDGGRTTDRTNWSDTYISYYPFGGAIALALDLSLRGRSDGRITLDDFMRAMWRVHGKPGGAREGYVDRPYTIDDAERRLVEVSGDAAFAHEFFAKYIHGREIPDFAKLVQPAGFMIRRPNTGRAWWGDVRIETRNGARIGSSPLANTPAYKAGLDVDDVVRQLDGTRVASAEDFAAVLRRHKPGDTIAVEFVDRSGATTVSTITLAEDPQMELVAAESVGRPLSVSQRTFRRAWLGQ
jgi:predicted metalloprotease with PDZ domain